MFNIIGARFTNSSNFHCLSIHKTSYKHFTIILNFSGAFAMKLVILF